MTKQFVPFDAPVAGPAAADGPSIGVEEYRVVTAPAYQLTEQGVEQALRDQIPGRKLGEAAVQEALERLLAE